MTEKTDEEKIKEWLEKNEPKKLPYKAARGHYASLSAKGKEYKL